MRENFGSTCKSLSCMQDPLTSTRKSFSSHARLSHVSTCESFSIHARASPYTQDPLLYTREPLLACKTSLPLPKSLPSTTKNLNAYAFRFFHSEGGRGIRTPARFDPPVGFQDRSLEPDLGIPPKYNEQKLCKSGPCRTRTYDRSVMSRVL